VDNTVNERIKEVRTTLNLSQEKFAKQILMAQGSLGSIETGDRKANERTLQLISNQFNVNLEWLKTGNGNMFNDEQPDIGLDNLIKLYNQLEKPLQEYLLAQTELLVKASSSRLDDD